MPASGRCTRSPATPSSASSTMRARRAMRAAMARAVVGGLASASAVMSAMKGCEPNSMVSDSGRTRAQNSDEAHSQPDRNPVAACALEIEEATMTRASCAGSTSAEVKTAPSCVRAP